MDKDDFAARVTTMQQSLYRVAASYLRGEADRLDAVCEAIARAWEKRGALRDERLFSTWITRILIRECVNIQRRQRRSVPVDVLPEQIQEEENSDVRSLREAIETLPQRQRTMLVLHYMEGFSTDEVARALRVPGTTVRSRMHRARLRLRAELDGKEGE